MVSHASTREDPTPRYFDVCNGDADGLCSVVQWRLHEPQDSVLVTGLKREIALLERITARAGDRILVCDLSMERNRVALLRALESGAQVRYFDHHVVREVPRHPALEAHIDVSSGVCTSALVDRHLRGRFRAWAVVGAFGDNLRELAGRLAAELGLAPGERERLRMLGEALNYNAYGDEERDVHIAPRLLYPLLARYRDPLAFLEHESIAHEIDALRRADLVRAMQVRPYWESDAAAVRVLPDAPWSRRVIGSLANEWAQAEPRRAHAVAKPGLDGALVISVRAPVDAPGGADELCRRFGGAGRAAAGGIDGLQPADLDRFVREIDTMRWGKGAATDAARAPGSRSP